MYNEYFGFTESPFNVTSDPRFFYSNRLYQEAFTGLRWGIKLRRGLIVMTGESGTGKTTLLKLVAEGFEPSIHMPLISSHHRNFAQMLRRILVNFGLPNPPNNRLIMLEKIRSYLTEEFKENRIVGLLLDEAQDMDVRTLKELELLLDLDIDSQKLLQIVLLGSPELETKLLHPELRSIKQRVALWCRLAPLKSHEVGPYIDHRLMRAGHQGRNLFAPDAIDQIALFSKGIPRLINIICDNALLAAYQAGQKSISPEVIQKVSHDLRLKKESEHRSTVFSPEVEKAVQHGYCSEPSKEDFIAPNPVANDQTTAHEERAWSFEEIPLGAENRPKQICRFKNFGGSKIVGVSAILVLAVGTAVTYFEGRQLSGVKKYDTVDVRRQINERAEEKPASEVFEGGFFDEISSSQVPTFQEPWVEQKTKPLPQKTVQVPQKNDQVSTKVYLHTPQQGDRLVIEEVGDALRVKGYTIPETRLTSGKTQGDVRFFFPQDRGAAEWVKSVVESELSRRGHPMTLQLLERDGKKFQFAAPGKIEVWIPPLPKSR